MSDAFDPVYAEIPDVFGSEPDPLLIRHCHELAPGCSVLDVGAGQGRHALHLSRRGHPVVALDPSQVAIDTMVRAGAEGLGPAHRHGGGAPERHSMAEVVLRRYAPSTR